MPSNWFKSPRDCHLLGSAPDPARRKAGQSEIIYEADLIRAAKQVITALAGPGATVRTDQLEAVRVLVCDRRRALVVQATGWGKSAVYWIAARAVRDAGSGPVLVVSPLLALMRDQVAAASRAGLRAITLNSSNVDDWSSLERDLASGSVDVADDCSSGKSVASRARKINSLR